MFFELFFLILKGVPGGSKRTTITHLDSKQKVEHQRRVAAAKRKSHIQHEHEPTSSRRSSSSTSSTRNKNNIKKSNKPTKPNKSITTTSYRRSSNNNRRNSVYNTSPSRRTMDIRFMGLPKVAIDQYLQMEHLNLRKEFKTKRKTIAKKRKSSQSHKRNHVEEEAEEAMDIAKQDSMDSLYSFIDKKVHDYTKHNSKKHSISYYKHHIHNGK